MRIVITSEADSVSAPFDKRFGRTAWFCVYDDETKDSVFYSNENLNASNGAGTKAAERMVELAIDKVISGDFGPKAKELLDKFNVQMVIIQDDGLTVQDVINKLN